MRAFKRVRAEGKERLSDNRRKYGTACSVVNIGVNLLLFAVKLIAGFISNSTVITVDAVHNLTDCVSSVIALLSFILGGRGQKEQQPKREKIAGLLIYIILMVTGLTLAAESVGKIISPEKVIFSPISLVILCFSFLVKLVTACFNFRRSKAIQSAALRASCADCLCDSFTTVISIIALVFAPFTDLNFDAWGGLAVSVIILAAALKNSLNLFE
ncbi:MAG: cation diffusion facilitator family transporter [Clostridiales bacterium]|nr:cation diffusion facilitator family transporter [Clostridiales bacterium]